MPAVMNSQPSRPPVMTTLPPLRRLWSVTRWMPPADPLGSRYLSTVLFLRAVQCSAGRTIKPLSP